MQLFENQTFVVTEKGKHHFFQGNSVSIKGIKGSTVQFEINPHKGKGVMPRELFESLVRQKKIKIIEKQTEEE